jgi:hypothetical protein
MRTSEMFQDGLARSGIPRASRSLLPYPRLLLLKHQEGISMPFVRTLVIAVLMICGAFFLAMGIGVPIPHLAWQSAPERDIAIGIVLIFAGIGVARFWEVPKDESQLIEEWKKSRKTPR